ncbi:hypothetical protein SAMN05216584_10898 [Selenomonas sp. WCT3]|uniref:hypothetical protein n=1 Tax=Selenomonas sp. WCT3 TaxID=3158785 RepID=UPI000888294D|nr:hypothetical protein SAMN05216584_10898 [Selenomonas ruminantium]
MKKILGITLSLAVWGALLTLQGTPAIDATIAEEAVIAAHPDAIVCEAEPVGHNFAVAYVDSQLNRGVVTIADDGHIVAEN